MAVNEAACRVGLSTLQLLQGDPGIVRGTQLRRQNVGGLAKPTVVDGQNGVAHALPTLDTEHTTVEIPPGSVQVQHRRGVWRGAGNVPGAQGLATFYGQLEYFGVRGRFARP